MSKKKKAPDHVCERELVEVVTSIGNRFKGYLKHQCVPQKYYTPGVSHLQKEREND